MQLTLKVDGQGIEWNGEPPSGVDSDKLACGLFKYVMDSRGSAITPPTVRRKGRAYYLAGAVMGAAWSLAVSTEH